MNVEYKSTISQTKNSTKNSRTEIDVSKHYASFGTKKKMQKISRNLNDHRKLNIAKIGNSFQNIAKLFRPKSETLSF